MTTAPSASIGATDGQFVLSRQWLRHVLTIMCCFATLQTRTSNRRPNAEFVFRLLHDALTGCFMKNRNVKMYDGEHVFQVCSLRLYIPHWSWCLFMKVVVKSPLLPS